MVFGVIGVVMLALVVVMLVTGRGGHGPGRHLQSGDVGGHRPTPGAHAQP
jgi:hypothetical protein